VHVADINSNVRYNDVGDCSWSERLL
jgi:hypothetical protein